jgi:hypothetical protein
MVYDWDPQKEICRRLYVEEKRPLDDIIDYMRIHHKFTPRYVILELFYAGGLSSSPYRLRVTTTTVRAPAAGTRFPGLRRLPRTLGSMQTESRTVILSRRS